MFVDISAGGKTSSIALNTKGEEDGWVWKSLASLSLTQNEAVSITVNSEGTEGTYVVVDALKLIPKPKAP